MVSFGAYRYRHDVLLDVHDVRAGLLLRLEAGAPERDDIRRYDHSLYARGVKYFNIYK